MDIYEESQQKVNVYSDCLQSRLNALKKVVKEAFATSSSVVQAVSDAPLVPVLISKEVSVHKNTLMTSVSSRRHQTILLLDLSSSRLSRNRRQLVLRPTYDSGVLSVVGASARFLVISCIIELPSFNFLCSVMPMI